MEANHFQRVDWKEQEEMHLLNIFSQEEWMLILKSLEDPKNSNKLSSGFPFFRRLLAPSINKLVFPAVHKILYDNFWSRTINRYKNSQNEYSLVPKEMLQCRRICKDWKNTVDSFLEEKSCLLLFRKEIMAELINDSTLIYSFKRFDQHKTPQSFQNHFDSTHLTANANPFIVRHLSVVFNEYRNTENDKMLEMLRKYGKHVWYCKIKADVWQDGVRNQAHVLYSWTREVLSALPNLKLLFTDVRHEAEFDYERGIPVENHDDVPPLPNLPKLEFLKIQRLPEPLKKAMYQGNNHIRHLENFTSFRNCEMLSNLEQLCVDWGSDWCFEDLTISRINWQFLTKLILDLRGVLYMKPRILWPWINNNFATSLRELRVWVPSSWPAEECTETLDLPNLEVLNFHFCREKGFVCLDFILPMQNTLKEFSVWKEREDEEDDFYTGRFILQFWNCRRDLHQSNIWPLFPKMEKLRYISPNPVEKYCRFSCTRAKFEEYTIEINS